MGSDDCSGTVGVGFSGGIGAYACSGAAGVGTSGSTGTQESAVAAEEPSSRGFDDVIPVGPHSTIIPGVAQCFVIGC